MSFLCVDSTTSDGSVSCGAVQLPSLWLFSLVSSEPNSWTNIWGKTLYFFNWLFCFWHLYPNILLLKLFHKLLPAKIYLSCQADVKY